MFNILINCCLCATMLVGGNMQINNIQNYLVNSNQAYLIVDNNYIYVEDMEGLNKKINQMLDDSYTMPAFGVSIHTETLKAMQNDVWLKLQYAQTNYVDDMPFDELLIEVNPEFEGFNVIRGNKGIYEGRCFYINLDNNTMEQLNDHIESLVK